jgi:hypothetical protein
MYIFRKQALWVVTNIYNLDNTICVCVHAKITYIQNKFSDTITKYEPSNDHVTKAVLLMAALARSILISPGLKAQNNLSQTCCHKGAIGSKGSTIVKEGNYFNRRQAIQTNLANLGESRVVSKTMRFHWKALV